MNHQAQKTILVHHVVSQLNTLSSKRSNGNEGSHILLISITQPQLTSERGMGSASSTNIS